MKFITQSRAYWCVGLLLALVFILHTLAPSSSELSIVFRYEF
jgi:hypothetical protein